MRAHAAAHFNWGDILTVTWPFAEAKLQSEYTGGEDERAYAVTIHGEIRGPGDSVEDAEPRNCACDVEDVAARCDRRDVHELRVGADADGAGRRAERRGRFPSSRPR
jgi:hypothetical protein